MHRTLALFEQTDWSSTELGPVEDWPRSLRSYVSMILEMPWPAIIFWGDHQVQIYNDGYAVIMGPRHPRYFGARYRDCWPDTYPTIYPWMRKVLDSGEVVEVQRTHIPLTRFGFDEEAHFTFIFSPLRDDEGRVAGILQPVFEVTAQVLSERRAELLRLISAVGRTSDPWPQLAAAIGTCPCDIPFMLIWERDLSGRLSLQASVGRDSVSDIGLARLEAASTTAAVTNESAVIDDLEGIAPSAGDDRPPAHRAFVLPMEDETGGTVRGVVAFGVSARLHLDERYRQFLEQAAQQVAAALRQATALGELERRRNYLNDLFQQAPAGIALLAGRDHIFELVNPIYRSMIGDRDVVGLPIREALPELVGRPFLDILDEVYLTGTPYVGREVPAWLDAGGERQEVVFTFLYQPLLDGERAVTGILVMCYDVSAHVQERQRAEALALELRQEHKRKDEFLAMLAHELRNPLAPISSAAEVLRRGGLDAARQQWASQLIARQVSHMASLIDDLLDVSRVTRGLVEIERRPVDLNSVVSEAAEQVRPLLESRRHHFTVTLPAGPAVVIAGDRKRLVQVVTNLLNNAAKYTAEGGKVAVEVSAGAHRARIDVSDNGIGIPAELLPRVFDLFVQAERSGDRAQGGLGIGLALVKTLVELHGGSVGAASNGAGRGSVFSVELERGADCVRPIQGVADEEPARAAVRQRVLVVDDNVDAAETLALQLQSLGHHVTIENDGVAALESAHRDPPDVCLFDIGLPGMDGHELARRLRRLPGGARALLVAVTGYGQDADRKRAMAAGFDRYEVKPIDPRRLPEVIGR